MDEDKSAFEAAAGNPIRTMNLVGGTVAFEYRVGAHRVIAAKMGSGCVNTAVTVARVLALNPVDRIISTGSAGAIGDKADEKASEDFSAFLKSYDGAGGKMVAELVKAMPVGKDEPAAHDALRELINE